MKLSEIADISTGYSFRSKIKDDSEGDTKVIQMSDVDKYRGILRNQLVSIKDFDPRSDRYFLQPGDVIMTSKGYNNDAYTIPGSLGKAVAVNSFLVMRLKTGKIIPEYLEWFLNSKRTQHFFKAVSAGTNIPNLSKRAVEGLEVTFPAMEKQYDIVELYQLKKQEVYLHQEIASKKEKLIDTLLQKQADKFNTNQ
jgi:restriction endonuclease S subunit